VNTWCRPAQPNQGRRSGRRGDRRGGRDEGRTCPRAGLARPV